MSSMNTIIETTKELVSIESICNKPKELLRAVDYMESLFEKTSAAIARYEKEKKPSIVISTHDTLEPDIILLGHLDVVPAPKEFFHLTEREGILRGRGVCDMKGEIGIMAEVLKDTLTTATRKRETSLALMLTTDEEIGGEAGAGYLLNEIGYRSKIAIIPDGGSSPTQLIVQNKGILQLKLTAHGKASHGSRPWLGENSIEKVYAAYKKIQEYFALEKKKLLDTAIRKNDGEDEHWHHTVSAGIIHGGEAINQVPGVAHIYLDIRYTSDVELPALLRKLEELADGCNFEVLAEGDVNHVQVDNPYIVQYKKSVQDSLGEPCIEARTHGSDDGRFFAKHGIPTIISRPVSGGQHSDDEWIDRNSMQTFYDILTQFVTQNSMKKKSV